jgi:hypothetical protein
MNLLRNLHDTAMEYSIFAGVALAKGLLEKSNEAYKIAFKLEKEAALMSAEEPDPLSHFILLRSAAALAYKAKLYQESERLIEICKAENPPTFILAELEEIQELIQKEKSNEAMQPEQSLQIEGIVTDILTEQNQVTVKNPSLAQSFIVVVPKNRLAEIVKKHWSKKVSIQARQTPHGVMVLEKISAAA